MIAANIASPAKKERTDETVKMSFLKSDNGISGSFAFVSHQMNEAES